MLDSKMKTECDKVIEEWKQVGGFLNSYGQGNLFIEDETVYFDWIKADNIKDTIENQKEFCRNALLSCGMYSDCEINELLIW